MFNSAISSTCCQFFRTKSIFPVIVFTEKHLKSVYAENLAVFVLVLSVLKSVAIEVSVFAFTLHKQCDAVPPQFSL